MRLSKSLIATTVLSLLNVGPPATAADLVAKARPVVATAAPSWSGVYFGGQAGYSWANASYTHINTSGFAESMSFHPTSAIGGAHAGLQGQWGSWLLGVEGTFNWTSLDELLTSVLRPPAFKTFELDGIGTVVGKAGYAANSWLFYVKGGWATAKIRTEGTNPTTAVTAASQLWENGWTVGGGVDRLVAANWVVGIDVNYYKIGFDRSAIATNGGAVTWTNSSADVYSVMGRISYLFGR